MYNKKKIEICDKLFLMALYVLQTITVNKFKEELKNVRGKSTRS